MIILSSSSVHKIDLTRPSRREKHVWCFHSSPACGSRRPQFFDERDRAKLVSNVKAALGVIQEIFSYLRPFVAYGWCERERGERRQQVEKLKASGKSVECKLILLSCSSVYECMSHEREDDQPKRSEWNFRDFRRAGLSASLMWREHKKCFQRRAFNIGIFEHEKDSFLPLFFFLLFS